MSTSLLKASLASSTRKAYKRFYERFDHFCHQNFEVVNSQATPVMVSHFIAYLYIQNFASSTIASHLSAISFFHRLNGYSDPCQDFLTQRVLLGCKKSAPSTDLRRPIMLKDLHKMVKACKTLFSFYENYLLSAIFLMAFHGFFRMGELISASKKRLRKVIQLQDVTCRSRSLQVCQKYYKSRRSQRPMSINITRKSKHCPVKALKSYIELRGSRAGPLFMLSNGKPITSCIFATYFKRVLEWVGLSPRFYKAHSFRIGTCTEAIMQGIPQESVMTLGRWSSRAAFKRYIRIL